MIGVENNAIVEKGKEYLSQVLLHLVDLNETELADLLKEFHPKACKKKAILVQQGKVTPLAFFVIKGCLRLYFNEDGKELTGSIATENEFLSSHESFFFQLPSSYEIEAILGRIILDMNGSSTIEFNGSSAQVIPTIYGSGGDAFNYINLKVNNSYGTSPQLTMDGAVMVSGNLDMTNGILTSTTANRMFVLNGGSCSNASNSSFVTGPLTKIGSDAFTFPIGTDNDYAPLGISAPLSSSDYFTAEYYQDNPGSVYDNSSKDANIETLASDEYWILDRVGTSSVSVTLSSDASRTDSIGEMNDMIVCHWNRSKWEDMGNSSYTGDNTSGTITSNPISDFSPLAKAKSVSGGAVLHVDLLSFTAKSVENVHVELQRSSDLKTWEVLGTIDGNGTATVMNNYNYLDYLPLSGNSYYRLQQFDFDGASEFSPIQSVYFDSKGLKKEELFPNPSSKDITIRGIDASLIVRVVNTAGQDLSHLISELSTGGDFIQIDIQKLPIGNYIAIIGADILRFSKQ